MGLWLKNGLGVSRRRDGQKEMGTRGWAGGMMGRGDDGSRPMCLICRAGISAAQAWHEKREKAQQRMEPRADGSELIRGDGHRSWQTHARQTPVSVPLLSARNLEQRSDVLLF